MARPLLLIPTELEQRRLPLDDDLDADIAIVGLGPVIAAARTAELIGRLCPSRVVLVGIAGTLHPEAAGVGDAVGFASVDLDGVGAGSGAGFQSAPSFGFPYWGGDDASPPIEGPLNLAGPDDGPALLTVCAASGSAADADRRRASYPAAVAEDMEGYGVAVSCALRHTPVHIVRGISNRAGDRDHGRWRIDQALEAAWPLAIAALGAGR